MRIRLFNRSDLAAVLAIQRRSPEAARWIEHDYERLAQDHGGQILVEELETTDPPKILGFTALYCVIDQAEIRNMAVDPEHRRRGVGRALVEDARARLLRAGAKRIFLEVRASNRAALALYYSVGFALHSRRKVYYREPPEDAYVLCLELRPPTVTSTTP